MSLVKRGEAVNELLRLEGEQRVGGARCTVEWAPPLPDRARWVRGLATERERRNQGDASRLLTLIAAQADALGMALVLQPQVEDEGGLDQQQLERFYRSRGYQTLQRDPLLLVRPPQWERVQGVGRG